MSKGAIITLVLLVIVVLGGMMGMKMRNQGQSSRDARKTAVELIHSSPTYREHRAYVDGLIDTHHGPSFKAAYMSGGLVAGADFDEEVYLTELWQRVAEAAERDNRLDVVQIVPGHAKATKGIPGLRKPTG